MLHAHLAAPRGAQAGQPLAQRVSGPSPPPPKAITDAQRSAVPPAFHPPWARRPRNKEAGEAPAGVAQTPSRCTCPPREPGRHRPHSLQGMGLVADASRAALCPKAATQGFWTGGFTAAAPATGRHPASISGTRACPGASPRVTPSQRRCRQPQGMSSSMSCSVGPGPPRAPAGQWHPQNWPPAPSAPGGDRGAGVSSGGTPAGAGGLGPPLRTCSTRQLPPAPQHRSTARTRRRGNSERRRALPAGLQDAEPFPQVCLAPRGRFEDKPPTAALPRLRSCRLQHCRAGQLPARSLPRTRPGPRLQGAAREPSWNWKGTQGALCWGRGWRAAPATAQPWGVERRQEVRAAQGAGSPAPGHCWPWTCADLLAGRPLLGHFGPQGSRHAGEGTAGSRKPQSTACTRGPAQLLP